METETETVEVDPKIRALAKHLDLTGEEFEEIEESTFNPGLFEYGRQEYFVLTDEEADEKARDYIRDSLWAFNTNFVVSHSTVEFSARAEKAFSKMQADLCEDANEIIFAIIGGEKGFEKFAEAAIRDDGRAHFLSHYDGHEYDVKIDGVTYYIYRVN